MARWGSEADLQRDIDEGTFEENHYVEAKREVGTSKSSNVELARDLAQFAIDGGTLIIGVEEHKDSKTFTLAPFEIPSGFSERVESIAHDRCQPPLSVRTTEISSDQHPGRGYLVVGIDPSPTAPHQVDGRYYGRASTQKQVLGDSEVRLRIAQRERTVEMGTEALQSYMNGDPVAAAGLPQTQGHLFVMCRPLDFAGRSAADHQWLLQTRAATQRGTVLGTDVVGLDALGGSVFPHHRQHGIALTSWREDLAAELEQRGEHHVVELGHTHEGQFTLFSTKLVYIDGIEGAGDMRCVKPWLVLRAVEQLCVLALAWAERHDYHGRWAVGFAATGIASTRHFDRSSYDPGPLYTQDRLEPHVVLVTTRELHEDPREVIRAVASDFLRVYGVHTFDATLMAPA